jgi:hypothetical protein
MGIFGNFLYPFKYFGNSLPKLGISLSLLCNQDGYFGNFLYPFKYFGNSSFTHLSISVTIYATLYFGNFL